MAVTLTKDSNVVYQTLLARIDHDETARSVEVLREQAITYVWGFQDGRGEPTDSGESWEFGKVYGIHAAYYALGTIGGRNAIPRAFAMWRAHGVIRL